MAFESIKADPNPIIVDNTVSPPEKHGTAKIVYAKDSSQEVWEKSPGQGWNGPLDVFLWVDDNRKQADSKGRHTVDLRPGEFYTAGVFNQSQGPTSTDPVGTTVTLFAVLKKPVVSQLITDHSGSVGGTWLTHALQTSIPTTVVLAGTSRSQATRDGIGIPTLNDPDAVLPKPLGPDLHHHFNLEPLVPGQRYFLTVMVVDAGGNWEVLDVEQTTMRRKLTVQFKQVHVYKDGDANSPGEADFWFRVYAGNSRQELHPLEEFHTSLDPINNNGDYSVGFSHIDTEPQTISPKRTGIWVNSNGVEHDPFWEPDDYAGGLSGTEQLSLPTGPGENVTAGSMRLDCPLQSGYDFHYGVDVNFSVAYLP
jgi:hypothetical protein